jgi:cytochrome P450
MSAQPQAGPDAAFDLGPVRWDPDLGVFVVTGYEEASAILRGQGWSSDPANSPLAPPELTDAPSGLMLFTDPPDHTRLRRLVAPAFAARAVQPLRGRIGAIVEACLDQLADEAAESPDGVVDLVRDYGYLIPLAVIAELLDVGVEGAQVFLEETPALARLLEIDAGPAEIEAATTAALNITMFLTPILSARQGSGAGADFISALLATPELELNEVLSTCILLLAAGHETTANLISAGALALIEHPEQRRHLAADPARAVEELLRLEGPIRTIGRTALQEVELGGVRIEAGSAVVILTEPANRDPRRWTDPETLDLSRPGPGSLAFGAGIHFCLGAPLARLEAAEGLSRLFARHPGLNRAAEETEWRSSSTFHALDQLLVRLE